MRSIIKANVKKYFEEAVRLDQTAPQDLRETLLRGHPRLEGFFDKIVESIIVAQKQLAKKNMVLKEKTIQDFTYDMTKFFMQGMEGEAKRRYESDLERRAREVEADQKKEFDAVLAGEAVGEFAEAGVITNEEIDNAREAYLENQDKQKQKARGLIL